MPYIELNNNRIEIHRKLRESNAIKLIPGAKWDGDGGHECGYCDAAHNGIWAMPLSWAACLQLRGMFGNDLQVGPALAEWGRSERDGRVNPCLELRTAEDADDLAAKFPTLHPFQRAGVKFMATARQALLADEMGLGKTVQAISALEEIGDAAYPALIVCPNSMKLTWQREFTKWAPGRSVVVINGPKRMKGDTKKKQLADAATHDVAIINWEALRLHTRLAGWGSMNLSEKDKTPKELNAVLWSTVVADEAHKAKEPKAQQTRALWWLGSTAQNRFMLTGTPVANSPVDIWSLMRFVSPEEFPAKSKFLDRYALLSWNAWGGMDVAGIKSEFKDELFGILDPRFIRRTKAAVLPQLPPKQYATRYVTMEPKQRKAYDMMREHMMTELEGGVLTASNPLVQLGRLLQFASALGEIDADGELKLTDPSCKVDALEEIAEELGGAKAVVFAESVQLINIAHARLVKLGYKCGLVTGGVTGAARQAFIDKFNSGELQFLLVTLGAGGEGLSLTGASTTVFLQSTFSAIKRQQAEDRLHGLGRGEEGKALEIIDIVAEDSIESRVQEILATKAERLEEIARDAETLKTWLAK